MNYSWSCCKQSTHLEAGPLDVDDHVGRAWPVVRQPLGDAAQLLYIACIGPCAASCLSILSRNSFTASCQPHMSSGPHKVNISHYIALWRMCSLSGKMRPARGIISYIVYSGGGSGTCAHDDRRKGVSAVNVAHSRQDAHSVVD